MRYDPALPVEPNDMDSLDSDKVLHDANQPLNQAIYSVTANDEHERVSRRQQPTIKQVVYKFLDNIKLRFGEESSEVVSILNVLGTFRAGGLSKKDTLVAIRLTLGDQADLKQDLLNILFHREADWGAGDFDLGLRQLSIPSSPCPQFLQPAHQPEMRLPPISALWYEQSYTYPSAQPTAIVDFSDNGGFDISASSSLHQIPDRFCRPDAFTTPVLKDSATPDFHMGGTYNAEDNPARKQYDADIVPQLGRSHPELEVTDHLDERGAYYGQPRSPTISNSKLGRAQSFASNHFDSPALSHEAHVSPTPSSSKGKIAMASPSVLGVPVAVPIGQPIDDMPPPSKGRRQSSKRQARVKDIGNEDTETASVTSPSTTVIDRLSVPPQSNEKVRDEHTMSHTESRPYIHSLCGKGFSSRSKVKKHHWGNKLDNLETTTGCWAKNNKPSVSWNEHPSCKEGRAPPRPVKNVPSVISRQKNSTQKAPMVPSMVSGLQDLSQTVSDTPRTSEGSEHSFEGPRSYHSHQLPTQTGFDNLLTAVNVASQIDAPRPQGRIDSVVSHLDAQAAATEHNRQYVTNWHDSSDDHGGQTLTYDRQHPYTAYGLGLQGIHAPVNMALPSFNGVYPYASSTHSSADAHWNNDRYSVYDGTDQSRATLGSPFSPSLDKEDQQF